MEIDIKHFGVIDLEPKQSDFLIGSVSSAEPIPESYLTPYHGEIYHQRKIPACGSHAGAYVKNIHEGRTHSPAYLWKRIKETDGYPPEAGTSMEAIFKALNKVGVCSSTLLKNDTSLSLEEYTDSSVLTPEMDKDALQSRIGAYAFDWKPTFESIKRAIYEHKVVLVRVEISADFWTPSWKGSDILPLGMDYPGQGGHFMILTAYDEDYIYGVNEWGKDWGDNGTFYFGKDYMPRVTYTGVCFDLVEKAPTVFKRLLKYGMKGTDVGALQKILRDKGYFPKEQSITSHFLGKTEIAVCAFQKANGLVVDGLAGDKTFAALQK